jgi:hypothetical protein
MQEAAGEKKYVRIITYLAIASAGLVAAGMVLKATYLYGPGLSSDAISYVTTAKNLAEGRGFLSYDKEPYVHWPPLLPSIMAAISFIGLSPMQAARFVNAVGFGLIVVLSGVLFRQKISSQLLVVFGVTVVLMSHTLLRVSVYAWTEPLFAVLTILFMLCITKFLEEERKSYLIAASVLAALSCLQRYLGIATILAGGVLLIFFVKENGRLKKVKNAAVFGIISFVPLAVWLIRNKIAAATAADYHLCLDTTLYQEVTKTLDSLTPWLVTAKIQPGQRIVIALIFVLALAALFLLRRYRFGKEHFGSSTLVKAIWVFIAAHTIFTLTAAVFANADADERIFSSVYPFVVLLVLIGLESGAKLLSVALKKELAGNLVVTGLCSLWLIGYCAPIVKGRLAYYERYGVPGYNSAYWNHSVVVDWLKTYKPTGRIFSNEPFAVYYWTNVTARLSPIHTVDITKFKRSMSPDEQNYLVWFYSYWPRQNYDLKELGEIFILKPVVQLPDGVVFVMEAK